MGPMIYPGWLLFSQKCCTRTFYYHLIVRIPLPKLVNDCSSVGYASIHKDAFVVPEKTLLCNQPNQEQERKIRLGHDRLTQERKTTHTLQIDLEASPLNKSLTPTTRQCQVTTLSVWSTVKIFAKTAHLRHCSMSKSR